MYGSLWPIRARRVWGLLLAAGVGHAGQWAAPPAVVAWQGGGRVARWQACARGGRPGAPAADARRWRPGRRPAQARPAGRGAPWRTLWRVCRVTAYCSRGTTASGIPSGVGQCAAPAEIPFGSRVYIPALGRSFVVTDRTARRFRHNTVDLFMPSRGQCRAFGRRYLECAFSIPADPPRYGAPLLERAVALLRP